MTAHLFAPFTLGDLTLKNRVAMSPMTRSRYDANGVPGELHARYYAQRAEAGLIVAEAARVSPQATGYVATPGIFSDPQVAGWRGVTDAVHAAGGAIFCQLWHVGRVSHTMFQPGGAAPVAPSAIAAPTQVFGPDGLLDTSAPRALSAQEIPGVVAEFRAAAENAKRAGFDGVEIHAGNGYLIQQFFSEGANQRTDGYGGSLENRLRFLFEVIDAVAQVWPEHRVSLRLSPQIPAPGIPDHGSWELYEAIAAGAKNRGVGLLHLGEFIGDHPMIPPGSGAKQRWAPRLKEIFAGPVMINGGLTGDAAARAVADYADLAAFGVPFLANPDLPTRIRRGLELNAPRTDLFYGGNEAGYTDYPRWEDTLAAELTAFSASLPAKMPADKLARLQTIMQRVLASGIDQQALKVGDTAPNFILPHADGTPFTLQEALDRGPVVLSFYRGGWCPYCNLELRALHRVLPDIAALGAALIAVSPELPEHAADTRQKQSLAFPVLSDVGNRVARDFGLVFEIDDELKVLYPEFGIDLLQRNGDDSHQLPVPGTYVIAPSGTVVFASAQADHARRAEPTAVLAALGAIKPSAG